MITDKYKKALNIQKKNYEECLLNQDFSENHNEYVRAKGRYEGFMEALSILKKVINDDDDEDDFDN